MPLSAGTLPAYDYDEYRRFEDSNPARHEFVDGHILAMAGGTPAHARLQAAILFALERRLEGGPCQPFGSDLRIKVVATGMATYPDVSVICGAVNTAPDDAVAVINPTLIVEVLSDRTETYDRRAKFEHYRKIPALRLYVLVSHRERRIEVRQCTQTRRWVEKVYGRGDRLPMPALDITITVDEIYERSPLTRRL